MLKNDSPQKTKIGFIGGSGLYDIDNLQDQQWHDITTPWGKPSDQLLTGHIDNIPCVFLPRHGRGHPIPPTKINYRANIAALKQMGVTDIISLSAVGSLKEELPPGHFVIVDQFIDRTTQRVKSFFDTGCVGHISLADPLCRRLGKELYNTAQEVSIPTSPKGTYIVIEGPQFSTRAESELYKSWGCSVIGMTNMPEAALAREAQLCYATVAMVTDFDCWHQSFENVSVKTVAQTMQSNLKEAKKLISHIVPKIGGKERHDCSCGCNHALEYAVATSQDAQDKNLTNKLGKIMPHKLFTS